MPTPSGNRPAKVHGGSVSASLGSGSPSARQARPRSTLRVQERCRLRWSRRSICRSGSAPTPRARLAQKDRSNVPSHFSNCCHLHGSAQLTWHQDPRPTCCWGCPSRFCEAAQSRRHRRGSLAHGAHGWARTASCCPSTVVPMLPQAGGRKLAACRVTVGRSEWLPPPRLHSTTVDAECRHRRVHRQEPCALLPPKQSTRQVPGSEPNLPTAAQSMPSCQVFRQRNPARAHSRASLPNPRQTRTTAADSAAAC